ncbi:MAG: hypothetical protein DRP08_01370 [Candidatus Aenigmatarchaeota archaeon]|nr:MAG: hypothetical protein DRP08_01370 [Candidatus Aenigmarchaeota archaeon]
MKFIVNFIRTGMSSFYIKKGGLALLEEVRKIKGQDITAEQVIQKEERFFNSISIEISEEIARKSGHFSTENERFVRISSPEIKKKIEGLFTIEIKEKINSGKILDHIFPKKEHKVYIVTFSPDSSAIIAEWEKANFPLEWEEDIPSHHTVLGYPQQ